MSDNAEIASVSIAGIQTRAVAGRPEPVRRKRDETPRWGMREAPSYLAAVRQSYDTVAADYVQRVPAPEAMPALERAMLAAFAELVRATDSGPVAGDSLGGILAWYSTYHTPPQHLPAVFTEFHRTLAPGGHLLLAVYVGNDEHFRPTQAYGGHPVSYESYLLALDRVVGLLGQAGLTVVAQLLQGTDDHAERPYACILARKPELP